MKALRLFAALALLPLAAFAADRAFKVDRSRSFVDVDVKATVDSFTGHLDRYDAQIGLDAAGKPRTAVFTFKFADLKTGKPDRDAKMIEWLGGGDPEGQFTLGVLALTPDGQGQASGKLAFHGTAQLVEFPVNVTRDTDGTLTITGSTTIDVRQWNLKVIRMALLLRVVPEVKIGLKIGGAPADAAK